MDVKLQDNPVLMEEVVLVIFQLHPTIPVNVLLKLLARIVQVSKYID